MREEVVYGDAKEDEYLLIIENEEYLIVHSNHLSYESSIVFTLGHKDTDWSTEMLLNAAKNVVDLLNKQSKEK